MRRFCVLAFFLLATVLCHCLAQEVTGSIVGTVKDASGEGVPGAIITVTNTDRNAVLRTATTSSDGEYSAPLLPIGRYAVSAEAKGFKKSVRQNIELNVNDKLTIDF